MKFEMEDEIDETPHSSKGMIQDSEGEDSELKEALSVITRKAQEQGISAQDLISKHSEESDEDDSSPDAVEEMDEESKDLSDGHGVGKKEGNSEDKTKKLAMHIARLRAKRG